MPEIPPADPFPVDALDVTYTNDMSASAITAKISHGSAGRKLESGAGALGG